MTNLKSFVAASIFAATAIASVGSAHAGEFDYLNHMNPAYTNCIKNTTAQVTPSMRDQVSGNVQKACEARYPAFVQHQASAPARATNGSEQGRVSGTLAKGIGSVMANMHRG